MRNFLFLGMLVFFLGGCATTTPRYTNNACAILAQKDGFFDNWEKAAKRAEMRYGIPMPIILATINMESGFRYNARPPRTKLLGFIPWKRQSTAYGYSQALNSTWTTYLRSTGKSFARRTSFADAADFVAWYHRQSVQRNGVRFDDAYNLYLNYRMGHGGYARKRGYASRALIQSAQRMANLAKHYEWQLRACGRR
ncbi:membrane protein [Bartonella rattaustraliani]|uniref:transglycosylase SLT domain-containing protein n=1 Tax=Bartonella rattaustraliani TaxID=481139 RepID=UPI00030DA530|nr:membrane protein [Bartonella rattaustraliani]